MVSNNFLINCNSAAVTIAYNPSTVYLGTGSPINPITPTVTGSPTSYSITPGLANGLSFSTSTGVISGTATGTSTGTYTVTATSAFNSNTASITINVGTPPSIAYTTPNNYPTGTAITTLAPTSSGVAASGYSAATSLYTPPTNPWGIGADPSGNIYVVNNAGNNVSKYTFAGAYVNIFIASVTAPSSIVFDAAGNAYVGTQAGAILKYNSSGMLVGTVATTPASVYGLGIDASGNIYAADYTTKAVYEYTNSVPGTLVLTIPASANLIDPTGVRVDAAGNIYICDVISSSQSQVKLFSPAGAYVSTLVSTGLGKPCYGFYMDKSNNIYVGDSGGNQVVVYTQTGTLEYTIMGPSSPRGLYADNSGNLFVTVFTPNLFYRYAPLGNYFLSSGGQLPPGLTFNSINGNITGTPTVAQNQYLYSYRLYQCRHTWYKQQFCY